MLSGGVSFVCLLLINTRNILFHKTYVIEIEDSFNLVR